MELRKTSTPSRTASCWKSWPTETGGRYWKPDELSRLPNEISYSEAGISVRDTKELWNMPVVFLCAAAADGGGMAAAAQVGCGMRAALLLCAAVAL